MTAPDLSKLCLHTVTTRPWAIETAVQKYAAAGIGGITVWRQALEGRLPTRVGRMIREFGLEVVSLCRGGFFASADAATRRSAVDDNHRAIDEAAALGAPLVVLVCGADPRQPLDVSRRQIAEGIAEVLPHAASSGIRLGIEPLHPMYADSRSAINTLRQATDMAVELSSDYLGVVVDVYHLWWDPGLEAEIQRCGQSGKIFAFHISDWKTPTTDLLNDRGLMGEGCIPLQRIRKAVAAAGFSGYHEVEIFSDVYWDIDQNEFLDRITIAYLQYQKGMTQ